MIRTSLSRTGRGGCRDRPSERSASPASTPLPDEAPPQEIQAGRNENHCEDREAQLLAHPPQLLVTLPGGVSQQRGARAPEDSRGDAPRQEPAIRHAGDPGGRRNDRTQEGGEPTQKDGLRSALAEPLAGPRPLLHAFSAEKAAAVTASEEVSDRIAGDRAENPRRQDSRERYAGSRRERASQNHDELAGNDESEEERGLAGGEKEHDHDRHGRGDGEKELDDPVDHDSSTGTTARASLPE